MYQMACRFGYVLASARLTNSVRDFRKLKSLCFITANDSYPHGNFLRCISTSNTNKSTVTTNETSSIFKKIINKIPFIDLNKSKAEAIGYILYESIVDKLDYVDFFETFELPDTFYSWFVVTELHIWMWSVRTMAEGDIGRHIRNCLVQALWSDAAVRAKKLGASNPAAIRTQLSTLGEQLQAALIAYDEGLQLNDRVLAGAIWRRFYQQGEVEPDNLDMFVKYIRIQLRILDTIPSEVLLSKEIASWKPAKTD